MEEQIKDNYLQIQNKLDSFINEKNAHDINKIKKKCESVYNDVLKYIVNGTMKKLNIDCFNWFEIFIKIFEFEPDAYISKIKIKKEKEKKDGAFSKTPKDYIISQNGKRIYKIISKSIDYINKTIDYNYDSNYCILDYIDGFIEDAKNREYFSYKENISELCMIFIDKPCEEIVKELHNKNIICLSIYDLPLEPIENTHECINIDINVIIALCSDINYLSSDAEDITKIIKNEIFVGFNVDETKNLTNEEYCKFIKKQRESLITEIKKYKRAIMCQCALNDVIRILNTNGSETEKSRANEIIKNLNIEIIDDTKYTLDIIENNIKNFDKIYNKVERDVIKIGYIFNALTFTSNHRYVDFLISNNIFIEAKISPSLNLISQIDKKNKRIFYKTT
jgi:hypothetical protein